MQWVKQGLIFVPPHDRAWMRKSAMLPTIVKRDGFYRIYFGGRDDQGRSQIGYFDFELANRRILRISEEPVLGFGSLGAFDDNGANTACIVTYQDNLYLYYTGWSQGVTVPFYIYGGLAKSSDGGETFQRVSRAPILDRTSIDPYLACSPAVLIEGDLWRMWYVSCTEWVIKNGEPKHYYHIKYAESYDGVRWKRDGLVCIDFKSPEEYAIGRPCVLKEDGLYKMWYPFRGQSYRIGYAESRDGLQWIRKDEESGIDVSASGWDSEMVTYPYVFDHEGQKYMLYNGNGYGNTGIGLAVLAPIHESV